MDRAPGPIGENHVELRDGRRLSYAEYGAPGGRAVLWFHGTPGACGQIPHAVRLAAARRDVRVIAVERPGTGGSTGHLYSAVVDFASDIEQLSDQLGLERFGLVGLSGGGPYVLACACRLPDRVVAAAVLGGVAPTKGTDSIAGGVVALAARFEPVLAFLREPLGIALTAFARLARPLESQAFWLYMRISPEGDRRVFARPEMKEMFLADLRTAARRALKAPIYDMVLFGRHWGFSLRDVVVPVRFWHGDADNIVPLDHGRHLAALVPDSELQVRPGESHLGALDLADEILDAIFACWPGEGEPTNRLAQV
jgi:pimeloyl-ACP methyl ester carboxylesterase